MVSEHGQRYDKIPLPAPLKLTSNVATEWKRFCTSTDDDMQLLYDTT